MSSDCKYMLIKLKEKKIKLLIKTNNFLFFLIFIHFLKEY